MRLLLESDSVEPPSPSERVTASSTHEPDASWVVLRRAVSRPTLGNSWLQAMGRKENELRVVVRVLSVPQAHRQKQVRQCEHELTADCFHQGLHQFRRAVCKSCKHEAQCLRWLQVDALRMSTCLSQAVPHLSRDEAVPTSLEGCAL